MVQNKTLIINVISQERQLLATTAESITVDTTSGQVTILPGHLPLFSQIEHGELVIRNQKQEEIIAISKGFLDVEPDNIVNIIVDTAVHERDISVSQAEEAIRKAQETMSHSADKEELIMAEASLRQALLEIKVSQKTKKSHLN